MNGDLAGAVRIYYKSGKGREVKSLLKSLFGTKYPYKDVINYGNYITYRCKKTKSNTMSTQRALLMSELEEIRRNVETARKIAEKSMDPNNKGNDYIAEVFPLLIGMRGGKSQKVNDFLFSKGLLSENQGEYFTDKTLNALRSYFNNGNMVSLPQSDYSKLFEVADQKSESSNNTLFYGVVAVFAAVILFFIIKKRKKS
jgi:hypothetical protein